MLFWRLYFCYFVIFKKLFQAIAGYTLRKSEKKLITLSGNTLNQRNHFAEG